MCSLQLIGAALVIAGVALLYLRRGPLISIIFLVLELLVIFVAIVMVLLGGAPSRWASDKARLPEMDVHSVSHKYRVDGRREYASS